VEGTGRLTEFAETLIPKKPEKMRESAKIITVPEKIAILYFYL